MAVVTVFVDDVVTGHLPAVCVRSGAPADTWVRDHAEVASPSPWWILLLFLGPPGWVALVLVLALGIGRERLQVQLPFAQGELDRVKEARRRRAVSIGVAVVVALLALSQAGALTGVAGYTALIVALGLVLAAALAHLRVASMEIGVSIDASRRWVTLRGVSGEFAAQTRAEQRRADDHGRHRR
jgi:hypothetical protein